MKQEDLKVLLVEDNPGDARLVREALREASTVPFDLVRAERLEDAMRLVAETHVDVVLLDLSLPDAQGLDTLTAMLAAAPDLPVVVLTGLDDEAVGVQAVRAGAQDYLVKGCLDCAMLVRCLRHAVERQRILAELDEARRQQLELKDRLLSHVSHELRAPLNAVYGYVNILLDGLAGEVSADQRDCLDIALTNARQLRTMIGDLLDATRADAGKLRIEPRRAAIDELIEDTLAALRAGATARGVTLSAEAPPNLASVYADPERVRQILANLVDNGIKFTPANGSVTVRARLAADEPGFVEVTVADTGCGISEDGKRKIFGRLHQEPNASGSSRRGLGLGLYICKELVTRQGGRISVESALGRGSEFRFTLPLFAERRPTADRPAVESHPSVRGGQPPP